MELNLSNLKRDYKQIRSVDFNIAHKLLGLVELVKINHYYARSKHLHSKKIKLLALCEGVGIDLRTLYRWRAAYIKKGIVGLATKKKRGREATPLLDRATELISEMRARFRWGSEVMQAHLRMDHSIFLTRYKIEQYLNRSGLRDKYPCTTKKAKAKKIKRHTKKVVITTAGEHTQLDTKHLPNILGEKTKCYVYNFVDHASNWSFKFAYSKLNQLTTEDFLNKLMKACPFKIKSVQTDHGFEFTYKFYWKMRDVKKEHPLEKFCNQYEIRHRLIVPGEKELQGLVERSHRQDDQEFYIRMEPMELNEFNRHLKEFCLFRNESRRFKKLEWKTPNEWLASCSISNVSEKSDEKIDKVTSNIEHENVKHIKGLEGNDDKKLTKKAA